MDVLSTLNVFVAVEAAIPADHPAARLAVPLGIVFFVGSIYLLLWSNYGAKKSAAITGVAWFGFSFMIGLFWWLGAPGIPAGLGISHLPGQGNDHYNPGWYAFEAGSERAAYFPSINNIDDFRPITEYLGVSVQDEDETFSDPKFADLSGAVSQASDRMRDLFLPIDANGIAQIGSERRQQFEADAAANQPAEAVRRAQPFYTARAVGEPRIIDDAATGLRVVVNEFQAFATFLDANAVALEPVPVGPSESRFAFYDPGQNAFPSALWTVVSLVLFLLSLWWLDASEQREKRMAMDAVEEPEDLAVPIAQ